MSQQAQRRILGLFRHAARAAAGRLRASATHRSPGAAVRYGFGPASPRAVM